MADAERFITRSEWDHITEENRQRIAGAIAEDNRLATPEQNAAVELKQTFYVRFGKRLLDILISLLALIVSSPINLVIAVVTYFDVGRPLLFKQERVGKDSRPFVLTKFRNMNNAVNEEGILLQPEERVTKWGRFVRKTSLDELLNLWCVFKGDMSIIGPRPLPQKYHERFSPFHRQRHLVRPGLECPFHSAEAAGAQGWQERLDNDIWYVENISFSTDVRMLFLLVKKVFSRKERAASAAGSTGEFIGYYPDGRVMCENGIPREYLKYIDTGVEV